jgi:hypothetical protein
MAQAATDPRGSTRLSLYMGTFHSFQRFLSDLSTVVFPEPLEWAPVLSATLAVHSR